MKISDMIIKDLKVALSDKAAIALLLIMPMVLMTILGFSLTFTFDDPSSMEKLKIAIVKEYDYGKEEGEILQLIRANTDMEINDLDLNDLNMEDIFFNNFLSSEAIGEIIEYQILVREEADEMLDNKQITAIVILPEGFIRDTMINFGTSFRNLVEIRVIGRTDKNIGTTIVEELMRGYTDILNYNIAAKNSFTRLYSRLGFQEDISKHMPIVIENVSNILAGERPEIQYELLNDRPPMNSRAYYTFAMSSMFVLFSAGYGSKLLLEEKDMKTYDRMSASGVKQGTIVMGKAGSIFCLILIQTIIAYIYSSLVLRVQWGNIGSLLPIFIASSFAVSGLSTMLAALVYKTGSYNMGNVFTSFLVQVMAVLGGSMIPIESLPSFARVVSNFTPNGLMLKALMKNYYGYGFKVYSEYLVALLAMGLVFILISAGILLMGRRSNHVKHTTVKTDAA